jgi:hypothetical protein
MDMNKLLVNLLICLQCISMIFLWTLDATNIVSEGKFAVFLAVNLLSFAMVAYAYRKLKVGQLISRIWMLLGSLGLVVLLFSGLFP